MSSPMRRLQLKIMRKKGIIPNRYKAINRMKGLPFRNCKVVRDSTGVIVSWTRYH